MRKVWNIKRVSIALLLLAVAGAGMWWLVTPRTVEPVYEGKTLSQWLERHVPTSSADPPYNSPGWHRAENALRKIGTNAIPALVGMIGARDPPRPVIKVREWAQRRRLIKTPYRYAMQRNEEAEYAFKVLGTNAAAAVPGLIRIYEDRVSPSSQRCAALALGNIGGPAQAAVPVLLRDFKSTNDQVRFYAVSAVLHIGGEPAIVIPALRSVLKDPYPGVRWNAVVALSMFGDKARAAVPDLLEALDDQSIKEQVEIALWRIAPENVGKPLVVCESTLIVANGRTTAAVVTVFKGERHTWIRPGTTVPCAFQFFSSEPHRLKLYRSTTETNDHFLGEFEVPAVPPPPATANVSLLCTITEQQILLSARDNRKDAFVAVNRVDK